MVFGAAALLRARRSAVSGATPLDIQLSDCDRSCAVQLLRENNMLSVPVVDSSEQFLGVFSVTDLFCALVKGAHVSLSFRPTANCNLRKALHPTHTAYIFTVSVLLTFCVSRG